MLRLAVISSHPIQYQAPLYRALAARQDVQLKVFFCWDFGVSSRVDPGFARSVVWDIPLLEGYHHEFVPNLAIRPSVTHFWGLLNPAISYRILRWKPDVVLVHGYVHFTEWQAFATMKVTNVPVLLRGESNLLGERPAWLRITKEAALGPLLRGMDGVVSIGSLNRAYYQHYGVPESRITLAPYTVDNDFFTQREASAREQAKLRRRELGIAQDDLVVLFAAKLIPVKGCSDLITAFGATTRPGATLVIAGDGPLRSKLEDLARTFPHVSIRFAGFSNQSEMPGTYAMGDVFVLPSHHEPWGLAVNEAMNLGLPVIVSDKVGSAPDLVSSTNGWVYPWGRVDSLSHVLTEALSNRRRLTEMGTASRERIRTWGIPETAAGFVTAAHKASAANRQGDRG